MAIIGWYEDLFFRHSRSEIIQWMHYYDQFQNNESKISD